jgi:hypothetical protein
MEAIAWFGFRVLGCRSTAKGAPWASFRSLGGFDFVFGGIRTPQTPFFRLYFFAPLCSLGPPGRFIFGWGPYKLQAAQAPSSKTHETAAATARLQNAAAQQLQAAGCGLWDGAEKR